MHATQVLADLSLAGVKLFADGELLRWKAPRGAVTQSHRAAILRHKPALLALLHQAAPVAASEPEVTPTPEPASTCAEVLRPDLREPLGLAALDADPPEDAPTNPAWASPAVWVRDLGVWQRCGGCVPTARTRSNWLRYFEAKKAWRAVRPTSMLTGEIYREHQAAQVLGAPAQEGLNE
jgi:hypothetical protein